MTQGTFREYLQNIEDALTSERVNDALSRCQYVQAQFPDALEVQRLLGEIYLKQGLLREAQQSFDWVLTNDPENVVVYCDRALISERVNDYETALDCYQQAYELSRGNADIRQQFNILSAKTGQQGFMLSRAGLARLYMRGDLLSQAAQEWEIVLSLTPDRLDARTGLLETYWREGLDERVEQLGHQILRDIPECLKALLLLAHVTAPRDMHQAREYIQRAEKLDPDLNMARELFSDAIAAQPGHPFWKLINKAPVVMGQAVVGQPQVQSPAVREQLLVPDAVSLAAAVPTSSPSSLIDWGLEGWQGVDALAAEPQQISPVREHSVAQLNQEAYNHNSATKKSVEDMPTMEVPQQKVEQSVSQQASPSDVSYAQSEWMPTESIQASSEQEYSWASAAPSSYETQDTFSSPPAWLSMLAQEEYKAPEEQPAAVNTNAQVVSLDSPSPVVPEVNLQNDHEGDEQAWAQELQQALNRSTAEEDDEEVSFFGPEWLKSLGAASLDEEEQPAQEAVLAEAPAVVEKTEVASQFTLSSPSLPVVTPEITPEATTLESPPLEAVGETEVIQDSSNNYEWLQALASLSPSTSQSEEDAQQLLTTLEGLEQDLRRQGFVPLEPNTLSTLAQAKESSETTSFTYESLRQDEQQAHVDSPVQEQVPTTFDWQQSKQEQDALLSSVLAQLGNFSASSTPQEAVSNSATPSGTGYDEQLLAVNQQTVAPSMQEEMPEWLAQFSAVPSPTMEQSEVDTELAQERAIELPTSLTYSMPVEMQQEQPVQSLPTHSEQSTQPSVSPRVEYVQPQQQAIPSESTLPARPMPLPVPVAQNERQMGVASLNDVFSDDLEVTMKRPAVRLQPVQASSQAHTQQRVASTTPVRGEQRGQVARNAGTGGYAGNVGMPQQPVSRGEGANYQERLRRGYQHQLVGDYDEAMQEYRVIIRNAPQLLDEVVSNVRALIKLSPKYSAAYRVLGDAYMRQGEYLQAMDAYNQALAITKKARV